MGYTHYFTVKESTQTNFNKFVDVCKKLHKSLPKKTDTAGGYFSDKPLIICGGNGTGKPIFSKDEICYNGDEKNGLEHEMFMINKNNLNWAFCKTSRKPYDLLVCACLIAGKTILGIEIESDGNVDDWKPAIKFYADVTGNTVE